MGADKYTECPKCLKKREVEFKKFETKHNESYGKVSRDTYLKNIEKLNEMKRELDTPIKTVREDFEIGIYDGEFEVDYSSSCSKCDFAFTYKFGDNLSEETG
jgi:hypothetical protein